MLRHLFKIGWSFVFCLILTIPVNAQSAINATLLIPDTSAFPRISAYLDVHNEQGGFIHGLELSDVQAYEDARQVEISKFMEISPGLQVVIALNPGDSFTIRNAKGLSRYDILSATITNWANHRTGSNLDDLSLIVPDSPGRTHLTDPQEFAQAASAYILNEDTANPNLDLVSSAIDLANDPTPRPGMERVILLFTSPLEDGQSLGIQDLVTRAAQNRIRIFIWLIGSEDAFVEKNTTQLASLAEQTGGTFTTSTTEDNSINLEDILEPLRHIYYFEYDSQTRDSGVHQLSLQFRYYDETIKTPLQNFEIQLLPPEAAFIMPPPKIMREPPPDENRSLGEDVDQADYLPKKIDLKILVDYPDGNPRSLVRSTLYIDRVAVAENTTPPFDQFSWDISKYDETGQHLIRIEVEDNLGLVGTSIETPVNIVLPTVTDSFLSTLTPHIPLIATLFTASAGLLLIFVLLMSGKIHPSSHSLLKGFSKKHKGELEDSGNFLGQEKDKLSHNITSWTNRFQKQPQITPKVLAYLNPIGDDNQDQDMVPIAITQEGLTIGHDILHANLVLNDPTIEPEHARINLRNDRKFYMTDEGSRAGTWVNYMPVSGDGVRLEHGDLIHIGRITYHFTQPDQSVRKTIIVKEAFDYDPF